MDLRGWIGLQHFVAHAAVDQEIVQRVTREQLTLRPVAGGNSLAWLLWHTARCEDLAVNVLVRRRAQVLTSDDWAGRMGTGDLWIGAGAGDEEVSEFGDRVDLDALFAYRKAVRDETASWIAELDPSALDEKHDLEGVLASITDMIPETAQWVREMWAPWPTSMYLNFTAIGHTYMHLGEMQGIRTALGMPGR